MKIALLSDFHGISPIEKAEALVRDEGVERVVFMGDYDDPSILEEIIQVSFPVDGLKKVILVGNHDVDFAFGRNVYSHGLEHSQEEYFELWGDNPSGDFVRGASEVFDGILHGVKVIHRFDQNYVYVHGALIGDPVYPMDLPETWGRLIDDGTTGFSGERRLMCNFNEMIKQDYDVMFRGHDHIFRAFSVPRGDSVHSLSAMTSFSDEGVLWKDRRHIVSVGAFCERRYAIFDDETRKLTFEEF
ncbi:metallophosphoesterase [archaeon]|jgi:predicted phosphodiesterase|nr:metallophosphoesterase [archaeon]MBT3577422.1 metallophosphoesterase [archaeon]MBT6820335.1 metallophosphoesterase [archaeon]MBT6956114.1 metallophosphoesterase [archaeon]MBT7025149.1 metallophosphoesterase [archaeon]